MKRLALLRHAKSSWDHADLADVDRPLNERGWKSARRMGREWNRRGIHFDLVLASPAARVRETLDGVREHFSFDAEIRFEPAIYMADTARLLELVRAIGNSIETVLLVGHNPGLERLLFTLSCDDQLGLRKRIASKFPTAAFALIEMPASDWAEIDLGTGEIVQLILAKELD
jgi:phosphohistidine phosphatase